MRHYTILYYTSYAIPPMLYLVYYTSCTMPRLGVPPASGALCARPLRARHVRSRDKVHARSKRRVLFLEFRDRPSEEPFLHIFVYRSPGESFSGPQLEAFEHLHRALSDGADLEMKGLSCGSSLH